MLIVDPAVIVDSAAGGRTIGSLAVFSICRATVTSGDAALSSIAGRLDRQLVSDDPMTEGLLMASGSPNGVIGCPTDVKNRSKTEQTG